MSEQEIKIPDLGGAEEVEVIEVIVSEGDSVEQEDPILTVESDKASVELPSPGAGKITSITVKVGDKVKEGDVVGKYEASDGSDDSDEEQESAQSEEESEGKKDESEEQSARDAGGEPADSKPAEKKKTGGTRKEVVKVPSLDGFEDVPVIEINVSAGDEVGEEDPLVTVESDKASMEIPSPYAGKVEKVLVKEGDKLSEGDDLLEMTIVEDDGGDEEAGESEDSRQPEGEKGSKEKQPTARKDDGKDSAESSGRAQDSTYEPPSPGTKVHAGPAVRKLARELGADL
ncbi:MAG: biotin/lipoyl-containing protein, partial [Pseudomonadota bacterium]|nr:biotin/lipoyl-containing protein [Pseudomonadota bacterium]